MTAISAASVSPKAISLPAKKDPVPAPAAPAPAPKADAPKAEALKAAALVKAPEKKPEPEKAKLSSENLRANYLKNSAPRTASGQAKTTAQTDNQAPAAAPAAGSKATAESKAPAASETAEAKAPTSDVTTATAGLTTAAPAAPLTQQFSAIAANIAGQASDEKAEKKGERKANPYSSAIFDTVDGEGEVPSPSPGEPPPDCPPVLDSFASYGDPHYKNGDGGSGTWGAGMAGKTINMLSDKGVQVNTELASWMDHKEQGRTVHSAFGIVIGEDPAKRDNLEYRRGEGSVPKRNGKEMTVGETVTLADGISKALWDGHNLHVTTNEYKIRVNDGSDLNFRRPTELPEGKPADYYHWLDVYVETTEKGAAADGWLPEGAFGWGIDREDDGEAKKTHTSEQIDALAKKYEVGSLTAYSDTTRGDDVEDPNQVDAPITASQQRIAADGAQSLAAHAPGIAPRIRDNNFQSQSYTARASGATSAPAGLAIQASAETSNEQPSEQGEESFSASPGTLAAESPETVGGGTALPVVTATTGSSSLWQALFENWLASMQASSKDVNAQFKLASEGSTNLSLETLLPTLMASLVGSTPASVKQQSNPFAL